MAAQYKTDVSFLLVYIREAHPTDGRQVPQNVRDGALLPSATTQEQKDEHANVCVVKLDIRFPTLVDKMDNKVELAYAGWPDRLYLVGKDGRILYKSRPGPRGFLPAELESAIKRAVARAAG
jgi:type I thyroxine 5'-deiodinase